MSNNWKIVTALFISLIFIPASNSSAYAQSELPSSWALSMIEEAINIGIVPNNLQRDYQKPITREQFSMLMIRMIESTTDIEIDKFLDSRGINVSSTNPFIDTSNKDVIIAYRLGIIKGITEDQFQPNEHITREEAAVIIARAADVLGRYTYNLAANFADGARIAPWASNSVDYVAHRGIMTGDTNNRFMPKETYTIEQAIITALRLHNDDGKLQISNELRLQIAKDGIIKRAKTYTTHTKYPVQWELTEIINKDVEPKERSYYDVNRHYLDVMPVGTEVGYAVESDTSVYINGKYVKSYAVGDLEVINLKELEQFGYKITEMKNAKIDEWRSGNLFQIEPMIKTHDEIVFYHDQKVDKSDYLIGNSVYTLIGSDYDLVIFDPSTVLERYQFRSMRLFTATTGDRFIAVQELTHDYYQPPEWNNLSKEKYLSFAHGDWYQPSVEQDQYFFLGSVREAGLALVDYTVDKELHVYTLDERERNLLHFNKDWWAMGLFPSLSRQLLNEREIEAFDYAQDIIADIIQPEMSERERADAIQNFLSNFDAVFDGSSYFDFFADEDPRQHIYGALLERDADATGWMNTNRLLYTLAGLDVFPIFGTEVYEEDKERYLEIALKVNGEWEFVKYLY